MVIPQAAAGDTYLIAVCTKDKYGAVTSPDTAPHMEITVAIKTETPNTPDGFTVRFERSALASWQEVTNADIAFYELRTDTEPGYETDTLLARTSDLGAAIPLTDRWGTVYLYAKGASGKYSAPASYRYNKKPPRKPNPPILQAVIGGIGIATESIPNGANGMNVYINGQVVHTENNTLSYTCKAGIYDVQIAYTDIFGEGEKSEPSRVTVKETISSQMLDDESISLSKVDRFVKEKLEGGDIARQETARIVSSFQDLERAKRNYSAFTQLTDAINLRVAKGDVINQINLTPTTTTIDGKYLHVTGQTVFDKNVITKGMIQANAITADKMDVSNLSAITANVGDLTGGSITGTSITGATITGGHITGTQIDAESFYASGYKVRSIDIIKKKFVPFAKITYPEGYDETNCIPFVSSIGEKFMVYDRWKGGYAAAPYDKVLEQGGITDEQEIQQATSFAESYIFAFYVYTEITGSDNNPIYQYHYIIPPALPGYIHDSKRIISHGGWTVSTEDDLDVLDGVFYWVWIGFICINQ